MQEDGRHEAPQLARRYEFVDLRGQGEATRRYRAGSCAATPVTQWLRGTCNAAHGRKPAGELGLVEWAGASQPVRLHNLAARVKTVGPIATPSTRSAPPCSQVA